MGVVIGTLFCGFGKDVPWTTRAEGIGVGIFGAVIGGDLASDLLFGRSPSNADFTMGKLMLAAAGAATMLVVLMVLRKTVGPLRERKPPKKHRF